MNPAFPTFSRRLLGQAELWVAGAAFIVMIGVIIANVFLRAVFSVSVLSTEEIAYLGFTWSTFPAVAWLYRQRALIAVDVFFALLPPGLQRVLSVLTDIALVAANAWFCWLAWVLASGGWVRKTPVLEIPYFWINLAPLAAFALMTVYSVVHLVQGLRGQAMPGNDLAAPEHLSP
ncbi:TRAP transporter small permease [Gemmobacter sp.]|uniref:TRAP transporter small permease n=1 Tax=Gemmobacter sp. TaxID=1898957 RepID=UPI002AFDE31C|nr:TRAP transporter small permease [Gemmobacter sp.]